ncbi:MAG: hypothetical protein EXS31_02530 [Pedosphaera sp.]|nr:hypothetical protein [Pedosphaera sp.]
MTMTELFNELKALDPETPVFIGFPSDEELQQIRNERHSAHIKQMERRETQNAAQFQELKRAALKSIKKDRP